MKKISNDFDKRTEFGNLDANISFLKETHEINKQKKILEIGSGTGGMLNYLHSQGYDVRGIELKQSRIEISQKLYGNLPLELVTSEILPFPDNSFDVVISFDVFEHIPNSDKHLQEVNRILNTGGFYLLQTPNKFTNIIFETIKWKSLTKWQTEHCSLHSYWSIVKRFEKNNFEAIEFYDIHIVTEFFKLKIQRYMGQLGLYLLKIINPDKLPLSLRTNFYLKARKK